MPFAWAARISTRPKPNVQIPLARRRGDPRGDEGAGERGGVGEHVAGVGEKRERAGEDPGDDLAGHEREDQREGDPECPAILLAAPQAVGVRMPVRDAVLVRVHRP